MNTPKKALRFLFVLISLMTVGSAWLKLTHSPAGDYFLDATLILYLLFITLCIIRIYRSKILARSEKWMYGIAVVCAGWIGGLLYLMFAEKGKDVSNIG